MTSALRDFFDLNNEIVFFVYGQVFFVLGLAIALQSRHHSRLDLARSLRWLALFGFSHAFHEWGLLLVPIQALYLPPQMVVFLLVTRIMLLAVSFVALFRFGAALYRVRWPWLRPLSLLVAVGATLLLLAIAVLLRPGVGVWEQWSSIGLRYFIGFPGALLAAFGLRYQAKRQIRPLGLEAIYETLRLGGLALVAYAFFAGLVVPYSDFFPANVLNQSLLVEALGIPVFIFRAFAGLILTITIIRAMEVFDLEVDSMIEEMELEQNLAVERERIGRELHDGAIQRIYTAVLIIESTLWKVEEESVLGQRLARAIAVLNESIASLRAYMTDLRGQPVSQSLAEGLAEQARDPRLTTLVDIGLDLDLPEELPLSPSQMAHVLAVVGEALANVVRHAAARQVEVSATCTDDRLNVQIVDDGTGFDPSAEEQGYGLRNMRDRARLLGGTLTIESEPGQGTAISLLVPLEEM